MEFDMQAVAWLVLLVVMLAAEAVTLGLTTIWFAAGALAFFGLPEQTVDPDSRIFRAAILLFAMRPVASKWLNKDRYAQNAEKVCSERRL
ncbi:MAG: NfeD family protein [Lachnospiraceae bacterium]